MLPGTIKAFFKRKEFLSLFFLLLLTTITYLPSLGGSFVWDDEIIINNQLNAARGFSVFQKSGIFYRPLSAIFFLIDRTLWSAPLGYHLTNLLLHLATVALVFLTLLRVFPQRDHVTVFFASALFSLHPVHADSVAWISGRTDVIASLFFFLALLTYVKYREEDRKGWLVASGAAYLISLLGKEVALAFPVTVLAYEVCLRKERFKTYRSALVMMAAVTLVYLVMRTGGDPLYAKTVVSNNLSGAQGEGGHLLDLLYATGFYLKSLLWPFGLSLDPSYKSVLNLLLTGGFLVFMAAAAIGKKFRTVFALLFLFSSIMPSLFVIFMASSSSQVAIRYLYLPVFGMAVLLTDAVDRWGGSRRMVRYAVSTLVVIVLVTGSSIRISQWKDEVSLWANEVKMNPHSVLTVAHYGTALVTSGHFSEAEPVLHKVSEMVKGDKHYETLLIADALCQLGVIRLEAKRYDEAEQFFRESLYYKPSNGPALYNLGLIYFAHYQELFNNAEDLLKAHKFFIESVRATPYNLKAVYMCAHTAELIGDMDVALWYYQRISQIAPPSDKWAIVAAVKAHQLAGGK